MAADPQCASVTNSQHTRSPSETTLPSSFGESGVSMSPPASSYTSPAALSAAGWQRREVPAALSLARSRLLLTWALGAVWLVDAGLQFQPYMYSADFPQSTLAPTGQGSPSWVSGPVSWLATLMGQHLLVSNTLSALLQLGIGIGIFIPRTRKPALVASMVWALLVWWLGEGLGMMLAGPVMMSTGAPGAVLLYALTAGLIWPVATARRSSVATCSPLTPIGAKLIWLTLWAVFAAGVVAAAVGGRLGPFDERATFTAATAANNTPATTQTRHRGRAPSWDPTTSSSSCATTASTPDDRPGGQSRERCPGQGS